MSPRGGSGRGKRKSGGGGGRRGGKGGRRRKQTRKGVLAAIRLAVTVLAVTGILAVGVNLTLLDTGEVDRLQDPANAWSGERVRVEVYNAGGVSGMAREATGVLRDAGFDVVTFDNAATFDPERESEVVDRVGRLDMAEAVAATLGIDNVLSEPDPNLYVDVTVVVGREWTVPSLEDEMTAPDMEDDWWDPRSWF